MTTATATQMTTKEAAFCKGWNHALHGYGAQSPYVDLDLTTEYERGFDAAIQARSDEDSWY
jgi:hypothetical protein